MQHHLLKRYSFCSWLVALLLMIACLPSLCGLQTQAEPRVQASVEIISWPTSVPMGQPLTVRWRITGGTEVSETRVEWGLESGSYDEGDEDAYEGAPGYYEHSFSLPYAATLYLRVMARVDGVEYRTLEKAVEVLCVASFSGNHDRDHAAPITVNQTYTGCSSEMGDWYVAQVPACSALNAYADPAPGERGAGHGVVIEAYDQAGNLIGEQYPYCGGAEGRCGAVWINRAYPTAGTIYLRVWGMSRSYELRANTSPLAIHSDEFYVCDGGPSADCWMPWYWHWTDPLGDAEYDLTREENVWWMYVPGGGMHDLHETTDAPRFTQSMCGDFAVQTDVALARTGSYQSAGLLVWQNAANFLRWEVNDSGALRMRGGAWTDSGDLEYVPGNVRLHVQRSGQRLDLFAFVGGAWTHYRSWDLTSGAVEVGLFVVNIGAETPASATFDYFRAVSPLSTPATPTPTPTSGTPVPAFEWRAEAEQGTVVAPMAIRAGAEACGGYYVSADAANDGEVSFSVAVPQPGNYYLWARARGVSWTGNSFTVAFDAATPFHYEVPQFGGVWAYGWDRVHVVDQPAAPIWLAAGAHTLHIRGREPGTVLDAVFLTASGSAVPSGCAAAPTATPTTTVPATATPTSTATRAPLPPRVRLPLICKTQIRR